MKKSTNIQTVEKMELDDYVVVVVDGCVRKISLEDFLSYITLGGLSICQAWLNCVIGIGTFEPPETPLNTPPKMGNVLISLINRKQNTIIPSTEFTDKYFDKDGDAFGKIVIVSGDLTGWSMNGQPLYVGQVITAAELLYGLEYDAKDVDTAYNQEWFFETYDVNNVKAE